MSQISSTQALVPDLSLPKPERLSGMRKWLATMGSIAAALAIPMTLLDDSSIKSAEMMVILIPSLFCLLTAFALHFRSLGSQIFARATWWSNLVLGTLASLFSNSREVSLGLLLALGSGVALLAMGRYGLDDKTPSGRFSPQAFRASLMLSMVLALADTQSLLFFGGMGVLDQKAPYALVCAALMVVAVIGLFRLKVWGVALNLVGNVATALLAVSGVLDLPNPIVGALVTTAVLQLLLPVPMLLAMWKNTAAPVADRPKNGRWAALSLLIACMMSLSIYGGLIHQGRLFHW